MIALDCHASFDSNIVLLCFQAVVLAACNTKFEFMRKFSSKISCIQFLCQCISINAATRTDSCALTGCDRTDSRSTDTCSDSAFCKFFFYFIDIFHFNKWNFNALSGSHMHISMSILFSYLCNCLYIFSSQISSHNCKS